VLKITARGSPQGGLVRGRSFLIMSALGVPMSTGP
jgi:hypothetical protein